MSGYGCSESTGGCGQRFRSLEGFDSHLRHDKDGLPWCTATAALLTSGWVWDSGYWLSPRDVKARARMAVGRPSGVGDSTQAAAETAAVPGGGEGVLGGLD